jgi:hypothetical protein
MVASSAFKRWRCSSDLRGRVNGAGDRGEQGDHVGVRTEGGGRRRRPNFGVDGAGGRARAGRCSS